MTRSLDEFFREKTRRAAATHINWEERKHEWTTAIQELYAQIQKFLADPLRDGIASLTRRPKTIVEQHLGEYSVDELILKVGDEEVVFSPKGRNIVGGIGRLDVRGESGEATLVLQPGPRWNFVKSKYPQLRTVPFTEDALEETLRSVMRQ